MPRMSARTIPRDSGKKNQGGGARVRELIAFSVGLAVGLAAHVGWEPARGGDEAARVTLVSGASAAEPWASERAGRTPAISAASRPRADGSGLRTAIDSTVFIEAGAGYGAGVVIDAQNHVLTCWHVVESARQIEVLAVDGRRMHAELVEHDARLDIALLALDAVGGGLPLAHIASVADVRLGQELFSVGAPREMHFTLSRGIASFVGRPFDGVLYVQTDIPTNGGNSGGPVLNERGEVVALSSFILRDSQGLSFGLPIGYALRRFSHHLPSLSWDAEAFDEWLLRSGADAMSRRD